MLTMEEWKVKAQSRTNTDWMDPESAQRLNDLETLSHGPWRKEEEQFSRLTLLGGVAFPF
jgi:hypothetical protein